VKFDHLTIKAHATTTDMYASIDKAVDKLQTLMRKYKSRIEDHTKKGLSAVDIQVNVLRGPYDELAEFNAEREHLEKIASIERYQPSKVIGSETRLLKMLTLDEAVMKMDLSGDLFLVFRSEEDQKLKVLYRRTDGNYGLIQPE
jgi:putative sigma-54 modulation protein